LADHVTFIYTNQPDFALE